MPSARLVSNCRHVDAGFLVVWQTYYLAIASFCIYSCSYGIQYFTPLIVDALQTDQFNGKTAAKAYTGNAYAHHTAIIALISAILFVPCAVTTVGNALISMRLRNRRFCAAVPMSIAGIMFMVRTAASLAVPRLAVTCPHSQPSSLNSRIQPLPRLHTAGLGAFSALQAGHSLSASSCHPY